MKAKRAELIRRTKAKPFFSITRNVNFINVALVVRRGGFLSPSLSLSKTGQTRLAQNCLFRNFLFRRNRIALPTVFGSTELTLFE